MKIYTNQNVYEAALDRVRFVFDEFPNVIADISGGKDSTVIFNLALQIAREKNRLPLRVMFIDQEAEWKAAIDHVRHIMENPDVKPMWFQMPIKIFNATSTIEPWLYCWEEGKEWIREKESNSFTVNKYGTDRFKELFDKIALVEFPDMPTAQLGGVRCEESPTRFLGLTTEATYKWVTWGKIINKRRGHYTFYPIYDWSYTDVWHAIFSNEWEYCRLYDYYYQYGVPFGKMRVSNVHHETAVQNLFRLQEVEPETWEKITARISGINTAGKLGKDDYFLNGKLPFMFRDWKEYRDYLLENLIEDTDIKTRFRAKFDEHDVVYAHMGDINKLYREHINTILCNDYHFTKLTNFESRPASFVYRKAQKGIPIYRDGSNEAYL
jgi:predicted phosphoadenosine phosphosulfate sulfurtransferase